MTVREQRGRKPSLVDLQPKRGRCQGLAKQAAQRAKPLDSDRSGGYCLGAASVSEKSSHYLHDCRRKS
jgi:hypothetical protein